MNNLARVQTAIDFIEENLDRNIQLTEISAVANMSHWHFQRIFRALTNETLKSYVRSRRIVNSLSTLQNKELSILDVAIATGFESHESYTRAFKKLFGITPSLFRESAQDNLIFQKYRFNESYLSNLNSNVELEPRFYSTSDRFFVGMTTECIGIESDKNNIAEKLPQLWENFVPRMQEVPNPKDQTGYGIISHKEDEYGNKTRLFYTACMQVNVLPENLPNGFDSIHLPAQHYAEFKHRGMVDVDSVNQSISYIYSSWLMNSNMRHTYDADVETYSYEFIPKSEDSIIYYAIPVEPITN